MNDEPVLTEETVDNFPGPGDGYTTIWWIEPPAKGAGFLATREKWDEDYTVRNIYEWTQPRSTMTEEQIAAILAEWHRRWTEERDRFLSETEALAEAHDDYGSSGARYFLSIASDLGIGG
jgi:hypothetical protein